MEDSISAKVMAASLLFTRAEPSNSDPESRAIEISNSHCCDMLTGTALISDLISNMSLLFPCSLMFTWTLVSNTEIMEACESVHI